MFELYELKEYVDSGLANYSGLIEKSQCKLNEYVILSDSSILNVFKTIKGRYPQTSDTTKI